MHAEASQSIFRTKSLNSKVQFVPDIILNKSGDDVKSSSTRDNSYFGTPTYIRYFEVRQYVGNNVFLK